MLEYDGTTGQVLRWHAYGLGPNAVLGQMDVVAGTRSMPIPDLLGSVIASVDAGSGTISKSGYLPYGGGMPATPFGFTGQRFDAETGLYYYRARHYSTAFGRFLQTDPIGYSEGPNLYAYVGNDPLNATDATGLAVDHNGSSDRATALLPSSTPMVAVYLSAFLPAENAAGGGFIPVVDPAPGPKRPNDPGLITMNPSRSAVGMGGGGGGTMQPQYPPSISFRTEHYAPRLQGYGIDPGAANAAVGREIAPSIPNISPGATFAGRLQLNGMSLEYRGYRLPNGDISIGTIFKVE